MGQRRPTVNNSFGSSDLVCQGSCQNYLSEACGGCFFCCCCCRPFSRLPRHSGASCQASVTCVVSQERGTARCRRQPRACLPSNRPNIGRLRFGWNRGTVATLV